MIERRRSKLHGWGVFAKVRIPKNTRIISYAGEKITHQESLKREAVYLQQGRIWCFLVDSRWVIDGSVGGNDLALHQSLLHAELLRADRGRGDLDPRLEDDRAAARNSRYNYQTDGEKSIQCRCRPDCRTWL